MGCGLQETPSSADEDDAAGESGEPATASTASASSDPTGNPPDSDPSTGSEDTTGGGPDSDTDYTGTDTDTDTGGDPQPSEWSCNTSGCVSRCRREEPLDHWQDEEVCWCTGSRSPDDWVSCDLPSGCSGDEVCIIQALRYGIVGEYYYDEDWGYKGWIEYYLEVLGNGQARLVSYASDHDCCGGAATSSYTDYSQVVDVIAPDDPAWDECLEEYDDDWSIRSCLRLDGFQAACTNEHLTECPPAPPEPDPEATCEETCPMAGDGVCDEAEVGTGLCADGCDPLDCTAPKP